MGISIANEKYHPGVIPTLTRLYAIKIPKNTTVSDTQITCKRHQTTHALRI